MNFLFILTFNIAWSQTNVSKTNIKSLHIHMNKSNQKNNMKQHFNKKQRSRITPIHSHKHTEHLNIREQPEHSGQFEINKFDNMPCIKPDTTFTIPNKEFKNLDQFPMPILEVD